LLHDGELFNIFQFFGVCFFFVFFFNELSPLFINFEVQYCCMGCITQQITILFILRCADFLQDKCKIFIFKSQIYTGIFLKYYIGGRITPQT
jgi:hypothetical protein